MNSPPHDLRTLPRALILQLHANPNISLGGGYRAYQGVSAAADPREVRSRLVTAQLDPSEIQGNVLRGYRSDLTAVRYLILEVVDRAAARRFLAVASSGGNAGVPAITTDVTWSGRQTMCFNIGVTFAGLRALGTPSASLATFPSEFVEGMTARTARLADYGDSAPANWPAPFDRPERVHIVATVYAGDADDSDATSTLDRVQAQVASAFDVIGVRNGGSFPGDRVHFGYVDSISQPRFRRRESSLEPIDPLGTVLLGYPTLLESLMFRVPTPPALGHNGSFNAFRILAQDVVGFEAYLDRAARELDARFSGDSLVGADQEPGRRAPHRRSPARAARGAAARPGRRPLPGAARDRRRPDVRPLAQRRAAGDQPRPAGSLGPADRVRLCRSVDLPRRLACAAGQSPERADGAADRQPHAPPRPAQRALWSALRPGPTGQ